MAPGKTLAIAMSVSDGRHEARWRGAVVEVGVVSLRRREVPQLVPQRLLAHQARHLAEAGAEHELVAFAGCHGIPPGMVWTPPAPCASHSGWLGHGLRGVRFSAPAASRRWRRR